MLESLDIRTLEALSRARRTGAERALMLARAITDRQTQDSLHEYADELANQAERLDAEIEMMREADPKPSGES